MSGSIGKVIEDDAPRLTRLLCDFAGCRKQSAGAEQLDVGVDDFENGLSECRAPGGEPQWTFNQIGFKELLEVPMDTRSYSLLSFGANTVCEADFQSCGWTAVV
jgi:hypothetical protein